MTSSYPSPIVTVDTVIFSLIDHRLHVLLVERQAPPAEGVWTLPGGFVHVDVDLDTEASARRVLAQKAGVSVRHLEQLASFGSRDRDARGWSVSVAYLALMDGSQLPTVAGARFVPVEMVEALPFDHGEILARALQRIRDKSSYSSLPAFLLGPIFTLPQLQRVYEEVLGTPLNAAAFRRKVLVQELIEEVCSTPLLNPGRGRPAQFYRLRQNVLQDLGRVVMLPDPRRGNLGN